MEGKPYICPYCGCKETIEAKQGGHGALFRRTSIFGLGKSLYHVVCQNCGTVIRSYIEDPQDWAEK